VLHSASSARRLEVRGNLIRLVSGPRFVMKGVVVYALPFYYVDHRVDRNLETVTNQAWRERARLFAAIRASGANTVRIPLSASVYDDNRYFPGGSAAYLSRLRGLVQTATADRLYVVLCWWDSLS